MVTVGIVRQSLCLSRVALAAPLALTLAAVLALSQALNADTLRLKKGNASVKQLQTFQAPIERTESKWREKL